ncbi:MAG: hypothetical protein ABI537_05640 [Casimicrobiaceae bacterium]
MTQPLLAAAGARTGTRLLKPSQSVAATARRTAERSLLVKPATTLAQIDAPRGRRAIWMIAVVVTALAVTATFAARHVFDASKIEPAVVADQAAPAVVSPVPVSAPAPLVTFTAKPGLAAPIADPAAKTAVVPDAPPAARIDAAKRTAARNRVMPVEVTPPPAEPAPVVQMLAVTPAPPPAPAREVPRPDPWQQLNDSLARCTGGLFDRIVCDQRVRAQFCDGKWGQVPQCPTRAPIDHGQ